MILTGFRCGECPHGTIGSGKGEDGCQPVSQDRCSPGFCYPGVECRMDEPSNLPKCDKCPDGMRGDGKHCQDIDEVGGSIEMKLLPSRRIDRNNTNTFSLDRDNNKSSFNGVRNCNICSFIEHEYVILYVHNITYYYECILL